MLDDVETLVGTDPDAAQMVLDEGHDGVPGQPIVLIPQCNALRVESVQAGALRADVLVLLSDVDQLLADVSDPTTAMTSVTGAEIEAMKRSGAASYGMNPKLTAALDALHGGAERILLANGTRAHALRDALDHSIPTTEVVR